MASLATVFPHPAARRQSADLGAALTAYGIEVIASKVYEVTGGRALKPEILNGLQADLYGAQLFYSRRTAETFPTASNWCAVSWTTGRGQGSTYSASPSLVAEPPDRGALRQPSASPTSQAKPA